MGFCDAGMADAMSGYTCTTRKFSDEETDEPPEEIERLLRR